MIRTRIFRARQGFLGHDEVESVVDEALAFVNEIGEARLVQITQAAYTRFGANAVVVWYRSAPGRPAGDQGSPGDGLASGS